MKNLFLIILWFFFCFSGFSQNQYFNDTLYKYNVGTQEPDITWKDTNYNDNSWQVGKFGLGFGENSDSTKLPLHTVSAYIRYPFTVDTAKKVLEASLLVEYDDGFIAYLNGVEIVRVNMGKHGEAAPYNRLADRSHEIIGNRGGLQPLIGYYIDSALLHKTLVNGKNILSVQVHNDSLNGSDLHFETYLFNLTTEHLTPYDGPWHVIKQAPLDSSLLPIIRIETNELGIVTDTGKVPAQMIVYNNTKGKYNRLTDIPELMTTIGIKLHGNSTLQWPKKNYTVETRDGAGNNINIPMLGLPAENDWVFNGPFADKSNIRNVFAYSLGRAIMSDWQPHTKYFELIVNGEFLGLYVLIESIKRDSNRVDIKKIKSTDISGNDLTGGYIFKMDQLGFEMVYPKTELLQPAQKKYSLACYALFGAYASAKTAVEYLDSINGFKNRINIQNYIDYTIVNEVVKSADAYQFSLFMHKDRDDVNSKLMFGPIWDFDLSCGNIHVQHANSTSGWQFNEAPCNKMYQTGVFRDTNMVKAFRNRWFELRKTILHKDSLNKRIDSIVAYAGDALKRNYDVWPYDGKMMDIWGYQHPAKTYQEDISMMKTFLSSHIDWIDANIKTLYFKMPPATGIIETMADNENIISFPNPFKNELKYVFNLPVNNTFTVEIYSTLGQKIFETTGKSSGINHNEINTQAFSNGLYYIVVSSNGIRKYSQTILKE
jgi:hypothetical protein